jgi:hypothetical protein
VSDIHTLLDYVAATGSISDASLFFTLPTRGLTGQQITAGGRYRFPSTEPLV